jgi:hypothetical protein
MQQELVTPLTSFAGSAAAGFFAKTFSGHISVGTGPGQVQGGGTGTCTSNGGLTNLHGSPEFKYPLAGEFIC